MIPTNSPNGVLSYPKRKLTSSIGSNSSIRQLTHCCNYPQLGKTAIQWTIPYRSCRSAPGQKMKGKDASIPKDIIDDCGILALLPPLLHYPLYAQLRRQGQRQPHQRLLNLLLSRPKMLSADKWQAHSRKPILCYSYDQHSILFRTAPLDNAVQAVVVESLCSDHASSTWYTIRNWHDTSVKVACTKLWDGSSTGQIL